MATAASPAAPAARPAFRKGHSVSASRRRPASLVKHVEPIRSNLTLIDQAEHALGVPEAQRYSEELFPRVLDWIGPFSDQQAQSVLDARHRERFVLFALTDGRPACAALIHEKGHVGWRVETRTCARCGLVVVDRTADGAHGRYCGVACRQGTVTPAMRETARRAINDVFRGHHLRRDGQHVEAYLTWYDSPEHAEAWEPNWEGLGDTDPEQAHLEGLDWPTTWQLRGELPPSLAIFAFIDGSGLVQDGFSDYRLVSDYRAEIVRHRTGAATTNAAGTVTGGR